MYMQLFIHHISCYIHIIYTQSRCCPQCHHSGGHCLVDEAQWIYWWPGISSSIFNQKQHSPKTKKTWQIAMFFFVGGGGCCCPSKMTFHENCWFFGGFEADIRATGAKEALRLYKSSIESFFNRANVKWLVKVHPCRTTPLRASGDCRFFCHFFGFVCRCLQGYVSF